MRLNIIQSSTWWTVSGTMILLALLLPFALGRFGPPVPFLLALIAALLVVAVAAPLLRSRSTWHVITRLGSVWGLGLAAVLASRMLLDALAPVDPVDLLLAQTADGFSEWDYPRRWVFGLAIVATCVAAGFVGVRRSGDVRVGTLVALATSVVGGVLAVLIGVIGRGVLGPTGFFFDAEGVLPISMIGTLLGTLGAMIGRGTRYSQAGSDDPRATAV